MSNFTKGPWAVNPVSAHVDVMVGQADGSVVPVPICALLWPTDERSEDETEANAHLISAAPELLAALRSARKTIQHLIEDGYTGYVTQRSEIDAAIAKALKTDTKGESHE